MRVKALGRPPEESFLQFVAGKLRNRIKDNEGRGFPGFSLRTND
jgi:hypothetical protein